MVLFGMGVDYSIHLTKRFRHELLVHPPEEALIETFVSTGRSVATSGVTTSFALLILAISDFRGFYDFGLIGGISIFIVTLAMMISAVGLAKFIAGQGGQVHTIIRMGDDQPGPPESFDRLGASVLTVERKVLPNGRIRDVKLLPVPGLFFIGCWLAALFVLHKLAVGRYIYAVGGSEETARLSGLPVAGVKIFVYAVSGGLAGLAAVELDQETRVGIWSQAHRVMIADAPIAPFIYVERFYLKRPDVHGLTLTGIDGEIPGDTRLAEVYLSR